MTYHIGGYLMSVELDFRLNGPLAVNDLLERSRLLLSRILNCSDVPILQAQEFRKGTPVRLVSGQELGPGQMLLISTDEQVGSTVSFVITEVPGVGERTGQDDESGLWGTVGVGTRVPPAFALAASVAVAAAEGREILDEGLFWNKSRSIAAPAFAEVVTLECRLSDFMQAAEAFYQRLPKGRGRR